MKFRILLGIHAQGAHQYGPNEVCESDVDLVKRFNAPKSIKFERVSDDTPVTPIGGTPGEPEEDDEFSNMTVPELQTFATEMDVDLEGATKKADILKKLRLAVNA